MYKKSLEDQIREAEMNRLSIKSKVMFQWKFHQELEKLLEKMEIQVREKVISQYATEYTQYSNHSMKIKIKDKTLMIEKLIACHFLYAKNDEKFWYITPQFVVTQKSHSTRTYELKKYRIDQQDTILSAVIEKLIDVIEEF